MPVTIRRVYGLIFLFLVVLALAGCGSEPTTLVPTETDIPTQQAETTPISTFPPPSETPTSPPPTATDAPVTPTVPPSPTADSALKDVELIGMGWMEDYQMLLSFQFSAPVDPDDYRVVMEDKDFPCQVITQHPDRLYCIGQGVKVLAVANIRVYPAGSTTPGFEKDVWIPYFTNDYSELPK